MASHFYSQIVTSRNLINYWMISGLKLESSKRWSQIECKNKTLLLRTVRLGFTSAQLKVKTSLC